MGMFDTKSFVEVMVKNICDDPLIPDWVQAQLKSGFVTTATINGNTINLADQAAGSINVAGNTIDLAKASVETVVVSNINSVLIPVALMIAAVFFLLGLLELGMSERMTPDLFVKTWAKLGVSIFLIYGSSQIVIFGSAASDWVLSLINRSMGGNMAGFRDTVKAAIEKTVEHLGLWKRIMLWMNLNLFQGLAHIACIAIATILISRRIELIIRGSFMPIAMAFVTTEGWQAGSIRYIKKYIALWLQGPAIGLIMKLSSLIYFSVLTSGLTTGDQSGGGLSTPILPFFIGIATLLGLIGAIRGTQQVMNDVMGA